MSGMQPVPPPLLGSTAPPIAGRDRAREPAGAMAGLARARRPGRPGHRHDALVILIALTVSVCLSLFVQPHPGEASISERLYYTFYNVAVGALALAGCAAGRPDRVSH